MINIIWGWVIGYSITVLIQATYAVYLMRYDIASLINNFVSRVAIMVHRLG